MGTAIGADDISPGQYIHFFLVALSERLFILLSILLLTI